MNTHVFIVNENTFDIHLKYKFAGTGATDKRVPFLQSCNTDAIHFTTEKNLVGMIADLSRIRIGDRIVFYLQATNKSPGMFFGFFRVEKEAFFDENDDKNYLRNELGRGLSFRVLIEPDEVFERGLTEHEFLDDISTKEHPYQLCWSLIYRKLKGNRGCTMLTDYEAEDLYNRLYEKNKGVLLKGVNYAYDELNQRIIVNNYTYTYEGLFGSISIEQRMLYKAGRGNAFETHLQAYILQMLDKLPLKELILPLPDEAFWVGNEFSCGMGMQKIDLLVKQEQAGKVYIKVIELKDEIPSETIIANQILWYVQWILSYMIPNYEGKQIFVQPCIIAKKTESLMIVDSIKNTPIHNQSATAYIMQTEYIAFFEISDNRISFEKMF